jgi:DNA-directed RNA polymerase subunit RPC12/RpoP
MEGKMIEEKTIEMTIKQKEPKLYICDKCKKEFIPEVDVFEIQEFHHIRFEGGYDSIFGDESIVKCDLCQHCLYELIGLFADIK